MTDSATLAQTRQKTTLTGFTALIHTQQYHLISISLFNLYTYVPQQ